MYLCGGSYGDTRTALSPTWGSVTLQVKLPGPQRGRGRYLVNHCSGCFVRVVVDTTRSSVCRPSKVDSPPSQGAEGELPSNQVKV